MAEPIEPCVRAEVAPSAASRQPRALLEEWLGVRSVEFSPPPDPREHWLGIVSSHATREQWAQSWWQRSLESAISHAQETDATVLFSAETPYAEILRHACARFGMAWREIVVESGGKACTPSGQAVILRMPTAQTSGSRSVAARAAHADAAVAALSDRLFALYARPHGKIAGWIVRRLQSEQFVPGSTLVAAQPPGLASPKALAWERDVHALGAVLWFPCGVPSNRNRAGTDGIARTAWRAWSCQQRIAPATHQCIARGPWGAEDGAFLVHCTRSRLGPWPDQAWDDYLDEVLRGEAGSRWHPMDSLLRILRMQRLVATRYLRRGTIDTVCFSEEGLPALLRNRRFQSHLGRWDWESYGIAIRRSWLQERGAKSVRYLPISELERCAPEELPFVQPHSHDARDWTYEKEWRIAGDLRLSDAGPGDVWLFAPSLQEARALAHESRWPVVIVDFEPAA